MRTAFKKNMTMEYEEAPELNAEEMPLSNLQRLLGHLGEGTLAWALVRAQIEAENEEEAAAALKNVIRELLAKTRNDDGNTD